MYADTVSYCSAPNMVQLTWKLNDWSKTNELYVDLKKAEYVVFGTHMKLHQIDSNLNFDVYLNNVLERKTFYNNLVVYLD